MSPVFKYFIMVLSIVTLVMTALLANGCGSNSPTSTSGPGSEDEAAIYAAVVRQLATVDDTFGGELKPARLFVIRHTDDRAGNPLGTAAPSTPIPEDIQKEIIEILQDLPSTLIWIDKFEDAEFDEKEPSLVKDGAIITLGNIHVQDDGSAHLAGSIYIANLGAGGATYVLKEKGESWEITGTTGPQWIS